MDCLRTFWRLFGGSGLEAPGDIFETFSAFRAQRARETPVRVGLVPKPRDMNAFLCGALHALEDKGIRVKKEILELKKAQGATRLGATGPRTSEREICL